MPFCSTDPCGGLEPKNFEAVKTKLMKQMIFHSQYEPQFHQRKLQKIFKNVMRMPDELISNTAKYQNRKKESPIRSRTQKNTAGPSNIPRIKKLADKI